MSKCPRSRNGPTEQAIWAEGMLLTTRPTLKSDKQSLLCAVLSGLFANAVPQWLYIEYGFKWKTFNAKKNCSCLWNAWNVLLRTIPACGQFYELPLNRNSLQPYRLPIYDIRIRISDLRNRQQYCKCMNRL